jgi:hypothetical protein
MVSAAMGQSFTVKGKVITDHDGEAASFAIVSIKSQDIKSVCDISGRFELHDVPEGNQVIEVECLGYSTLKHTFTARKGMAIMQLTLKNNSFALPELQVMAKKSRMGASLRYGRRTVGAHHYNVVMQNTKVKHLDFQQAFASYAYRAADLTQFVLMLSWEHQFGKLTAGMNASFYSAAGERLSDVAYTGMIGYPSTAPMLSVMPDLHDEKRGDLTVYVKF